MTLYRKGVGNTGERLAANFLIENGFEILGKNFRTKYGEIDIIARKDNKLHFVEVKTRSNIKKSLPHEAVNYRKIQHLKKAINYYLLKNKIKDSKLSLDVISIILEKNDIVKQLKYFQSVTL